MCHVTCVMCHVSCVMCHARFKSVECDVSRPIHECDLPRVWLRKNSFISVSDDCGTGSSVMWLWWVVSWQVTEFTSHWVDKSLSSQVTELTRHCVDNSLSWHVTDHSVQNSRPLPTRTGYTYIYELWVDKSLCSQVTELTSHWVHNSLITQFKTQFTTHKTKSNTNFSCEWQFTTHF